MRTFLTEFSLLKILVSNSLAQKKQQENQMVQLWTNFSQQRCTKHTRWAKKSISLQFIHFKPDLTVQKCKNRRGSRTNTHQVVPCLIYKQK